MQQKNSNKRNLAATRNKINSTCLWEWPTKTLSQFVKQKGILRKSGAKAWGVWNARPWSLLVSSGCHHTHGTRYTFTTLMGQHRHIGQDTLMGQDTLSPHSWDSTLSSQSWDKRYMLSPHSWDKIHCHHSVGIRYTVTTLFGTKYTATTFMGQDTLSPHSWDKR